MMKDLLLAFTLSAAPLSGADLPGWKLVWGDEFDKPSSPDSEKWNQEKGMIRNAEKQFYTEKESRNAHVENGNLVIEAHKENRGEGEFTSASLISRGHGEWTYGRIEVRAKLPSARGTWPAIWMLPADIDGVSWPKCGEIDIMEHVGYDPGVIHGTLHSEAYNHTKGTQKSGNVLLKTFSSDFHTYTVEWSKEKIVTEVDGKVYAEFTRKFDDGVDQWPFDKPFYLIINLAVGGGWGGQRGIDETAFPQRMEVDFVRVYQKLR